MMMMQTFLVLLAGLVCVVRSEIQSMEVILDASSTEVHFVRGMLNAPAHIDLSNMEFMTIEEPDFYFGDDEFVDDDSLEGDDGFDDGGIDWNDTPSPTQAATEAATEASTDLATDANTTVATEAPTEETTSATTEPPPDAATPPPPEPVDDSTEAPTSAGVRKLEDLNGGGVSSQRVKQVLDIIVFRIPEDCRENYWGGCDWSTLGVGTVDDEVNGGVSYCCSEDTAGRGLCDSQDIGNFIVDHSIFTGDHRVVDVPTATEETFQMDDPVFNIEESGDHVLILANCDDYGLEVFALGAMEWKSVNGYLPGEKFSLMAFYGICTAIYAVLISVYYFGMRVYQEAAIRIQRWILATMILGFFELLFRLIDYGMWNVDGNRGIGIVWTALIIGVLKRAISRCLLVMVAMGWGVVRDSLGLTLIKIIFLGMAYTGLSLGDDFLTVLAVSKVETWSITVEEELFGLANLLDFAVVLVDVLFYVWIYSSLLATTGYLKNMNQTSKLRRHLWLRCIIMMAFFFSFAWYIFSVADDKLEILTTDQEWIPEAAMHGNALFVLIGVAILWRPNSNAKDYAMQMEIPAMGDDDENELELSCVVPSAGEIYDDDGNDPDHPNGLRVDSGFVS